MHKTATKNSDRVIDPTRRRAIVAVSVGGIIALLLAEFLVRIVLPHPAHYRGHPANVPGLVTQHDTRGYSWTPGFEGIMTSDNFGTTYVISSQGFRDDYVENDGAQRILAIGDSFTGGEGTEADEAWPRQLEILLNNDARPGIHTRLINAGVTGYSARQMRQMAEQVVPIFEPEHVIVGIFTNGYDRVENPFVLVGEHLVRQEFVTKMRVLDNGKIWWNQTEFENSTAAKFEIWCQSYWHFAAYAIKVVHRVRRMATQSSALNAEPLPATIRLEPVFGELLLLDDYLRLQGIALTVLVICVQGADGDFISDNKVLAAALQEFGDEHNIQIVDPTSALEARADGKPIFRYATDAHWTPLAHAAVAQEIHTYLQQMD